MEVLTATHSNLPKGLSYIDKLLKFENEEISDEDFQEIRHTYRRRAVNTQMMCGLDIITDGQLEWKDEINHIFKKFPSVTYSSGHLMVSGKHNQVYEIPILHKRCDLLNDEFLFEAEVSEMKRCNIANKDMKFCLPGPYSLFCFSENNTGLGPAGYIMSLARIVASQIKHLLRHFKWVQINEPALYFKPKSVDYALLGIEAMYNYLKVDSQRNTRMNLYNLILHVPYCDFPKTVLNWINESSVFKGILGIDWVNGNKDISRYLNNGHGLQVGIIDYKKEIQDIDKMANELVDIEEKLYKNGTEFLIITTNSGLANNTGDRAKFKLLQTVALSNLI